MSDRCYGIYSTETTCVSSGYGSISTIDEEEGVQYWMPLKIPQRKNLTAKEVNFNRTCSVTADTVETDSLLDADSASSDGVSMAAYFFAFLGFKNNPFASGGDIRNTKAADMRLAMLSNFSTAYNVVSISLALDIMQRIYPATPEDKSLCSSALIAGMIAGQLVGGTLGDILGRHLAMTIVMTLQIMGALVTALASDGYISIYMFIAFWRFILGLGCGGVYPLAATITAEASSEKEDSSKAVALVFSMQGVGYLVAPLLTTVLATLFPHAHGLCWRFLLGFGAVPGIWLMLLRIGTQLSLRLASTSDQMHEKMILATAREVPVSILDAIAVEKDLFRKLCGTGGCWFLFDVLFYGNVLFQPVVLSAAFGSAETVQKSAIDTSIVSGLALPGYFASVIMMGRQSPRFIQAQGFLIMSILYGFIGIFFDQLAEHKVLLIVLYGSTFFFSSYGPNSTTYVLPSMTFSQSCRSTLNGFCAACGKAGALIGSMLFVTATSQFGEQTVMMACAVVSGIGLAVTLVCVSENLTVDDEQIALREKVPMKVVLSEPSLVDFYQSS